MTRRRAAQQAEPNLCTARKFRHRLRPSEPLQSFIARGRKVICAGASGACDLMASRPRNSGGVENRREVSAGGLIWRRNPAGAIEVVLVKPAGKDCWAIPKGHLEKGETIAQAATREVREETGLTVSETLPLGDVSYVYSFHENEGGPLIRIFKRVHFFLMRSHGGDTSNHDAEVDQVAWVDLDHAMRKASFDTERKLIAKAAAILAE